MELSECSPSSLEFVRYMDMKRAQGRSDISKPSSFRPIHAESTLSLYLALSDPEKMYFKLLTAGPTVEQLASDYTKFGGHLPFKQPLLQEV